MRICFRASREKLFSTKSPIAVYSRSSIRLQQFGLELTIGFVNVEYDYTCQQNQLNVPLPHSEA